jgi:hypothetical protein
MEQWTELSYSELKSYLSSPQVNRLVNFLLNKYG